MFFIRKRFLNIVWEVSFFISERRDYFMNKNNRLLQKLCNSRKETLSYEEVVSSARFKALLDKFVLFITESTHPVPVQLVKYAPVTACTDSRQIMVNVFNELTRTFPNTELKTSSLLGLVFHEIGHLLYSDFSLRKRFLEEIEESGRFNSYYEDEVTMKEVQEYMKKYPTIKKVVSVSMAKITNVVEDIFIETLLSHLFKGSVKSYLTLNRLRIAETSPSLEQMKKDGYSHQAILYNLIIQYASAGDYNNWQNLDDEYTKALERAKPIIDNAVRSLTAQGRLNKSTDIFLATWKVLKDEIDDLENRINIVDGEKESSSGNGGQENMAPPEGDINVNKNAEGQTDAPQRPPEVVDALINDLLDKVDKEVKDTSVDNEVSENSELFKGKQPEKKQKEKSPDDGGDENTNKDDSNATDSTADASESGENDAGGSSDDTEPANEAEIEGSADSAEGGLPEEAGAVDDDSTRNASPGVMPEGCGCEDDEELPFADDENIKPDDTEPANEGMSDSSDSADDTGTDSFPEITDEGKGTETERTGDISEPANESDTESETGNEDSNQESLSGGFISGSSITADEAEADGNTDEGYEAGTDSNDASGEKTGNEGSDKESDMEADGSFAGNDETNPVNEREKSMQNGMQEEAGADTSSETETPDGNSKPSPDEADKESFDTSVYDIEDDVMEEMESLADEVGSELTENGERADDTGNDGTVPKSERRDLLNNAFKDMLNEIAKDKVCEDLIRENERELQEEAGSVDLGDMHKGVNIIVNRHIEVTEADIKRYKYISPEPLKVAKTLTRKMERILRNKQTAMEKNVIFGKRLSKTPVDRQGKIFNRKAIPNETDLAVTLLIDESGSMWGIRNHASIVTSIILQDFCNSLDIPLQIAGHNSSSLNVYYDVFKDFNETDGKDKYRLTKLAADRNNRDGAALQFACELLLKRPERNKLLILISDGQPAANNYYGKGAHEDLRNIKKRLQNKGVTMFVAAIGDDKEQIKAIYKDNFLDITDLDKLPVNMVRLVERFIK